MTRTDLYEMTIGIECHVQLDTNTKLFSTSNNDSRDAEPNTNITANDYALPGTLPLLNKRAVELAVKAGKALNSKVAAFSTFDRKHYFYPDLPKGYQTTQNYNPIIGPGLVKAPLEDGTFVEVRIHHAHLEEDAGKLTHESDHSLVDLNRAGTPLIEIVSEPDIHSPQAARAFASELHKLMVYSGVTKGDLYHGNMRFDVNISVAPKGSDKLGRRAEVKNLNSFRSVEKAAEYEFIRQVKLLEAGEEVAQETRGWNEDTQTTSSQRSKEDAQDYRYMPDADIPPIKLSESQIESLQAEVPMLPQDYRDAWEGLNLDKSVIDTLLYEQTHATLVYEVQEKAGDSAARRLAHWISSTLSGEGGMSEIKQSSSSPFIELAEMVDKKEVSSSNAKDLFLLVASGESDTPRELAKSRGMIQNSDSGVIESVVDEVLQDPASSKAIEDIRNGNEKAIGYLVGQVMKRSKGQANPAMATEILKKKL